MKLKLLPDGWSALGAVSVGALASIGFGLAGCVGDIAAPAAKLAGDAYTASQAAKAAPAADK